MAGVSSKVALQAAISARLDGVVTPEPPGPGATPVDPVAMDPATFFEQSPRPLPRVGGAA